MKLRRKGVPKYFLYGCWLLPMLRRGSSSGASAPSALSLMVPEYQMSGGVFTAATIPLQGFLPVVGVGWWYVGPNVLEDVTISSKGGRRVRWSYACVSVTTSWWCQNIKCRVVFPPLPPFPSNSVNGIGWWYVGPDVLEDVTISPMNGGGHNGHGETGKYAVRRGAQIDVRLAFFDLCLGLSLSLFKCWCCWCCCCWCCNLSPHCTSLDLLYLDWRHALSPPGLSGICGMNIQVGIVHPPWPFKKTFI
jgi:hypothetical protein